MSDEREIATPKPEAESQEKAVDAKDKGVAAEQTPMGTGGREKSFLDGLMGDASEAKAPSAAGAKQEASKPEKEAAPAKGAELESKITQTTKASEALKIEVAGLGQDTTEKSVSARGGEQAVAQAPGQGPDKGADGGRQMEMTMPAALEAKHAQVAKDQAEVKTAYAPDATASKVEDKDKGVEPKEKAAQDKSAEPEKANDASSAAAKEKVHDVQDKSADKGAEAKHKSSDRRPTLDEIKEKNASKAKTPKAEKTRSVGRD